VNTKVKAEKRIVEFLESNNGTMVLSGTHMFEKHKLVLEVLEKYFINLKILLRVNTLQDTQSRNFLGMRVKTGTKYKLGRNIVYIDSINSNSWGNTPNDFDIAIIYPAGVFANKESQMTKNNLSDIFEIKNINKIIFVTCQERTDISYLKEYDDIFHVEYDSEEDDIDYHNRVLENKATYGFEK